MTQEFPANISADELSEWIITKTPKPILIDVREDNEIAFAPFPAKVLHLPLSKSSHWISSLAEKLPSNKPVVVICHAGIRSWNFSNWLIEQNLVKEVWNLEGGIDSWSVNIDPKVPRY